MSLGWGSDIFGSGVVSGVTDHCVEQTHCIAPVSELLEGSSETSMVSKMRKVRVSVPLG